MEKITKTLLESLNSEPTKEIKIVKESEENVHKVKDCLDDVDIITALEGDTLMIEDMDDWNRILLLAREFSSSQGFYGRLLHSMNEYEQEVGAENIHLPIYMQGGLIMSKFYYQLKCKLDENKEDWYYLCNDAEQALFKVKEQCKDESAIKSLERMIIDLNSIRMEQYERLTEYSLVEEVVAATN